jgi:outer membrane biosynthesis protein TonB
MMEAVDSPRPAPAGRAVWALVISAALHAMLLLSAAGKPDGGILMDKAVNPPAAAASTLQVMFQQAGAAIDLVTGTPETAAPVPENATPALITGSEPVAGRDGVLPLGSSPRYYLPNELDTRPQIRNRIDPVYPKAAAEQGITAAFTLRLFIDEKGQVENVVVPGKNASDPFVAAVVAAFSSAVYTPGLKNGVAVKSLLLIEVNFEALDVAETFRGKSY